LYRPALLAQAVVRYLSAKANVNTDRRFTFVAPDPGAALPHWAECAAPALDPAALSRTPPAAARLAPDIPAALTDSKKLTAWQKDLTAYLYRTADFTLHQNAALKLFSQPGQSYEEFRAVCQQAAAAGRTEEIEVLRSKYDVKIDRLEDKLLAEKRELGEDIEQLKGRQDETRWTVVENAVGFVFGRSPRRMISTSVSKGRLERRAKDDVTESEQAVTQYQTQIEALKAEAQAAFQASAAKWQQAADAIQDLRLTPKRTDILIEFFGLGWLPYWQIEADGKPVEIPAFKL
jgi:hypothetical protein